MQHVGAYRAETEWVQEQMPMKHAEAMSEIEQFKSELLHTMSHELRSPLASIQGYTAALLRYDKRLRRQEQREFLEAIRDASDTLSVLVDRLLEMAAFDAHAVQLHPSPIDMLHLAREAMHAAQHAWHPMQVHAARPHVFTFHLNATDEQGRGTESVPLVWGDQYRLRQVLDNILENAMKFSPDGGAITLTLRVLPASQADSQGRPYMLEITVQDQGVGIAGEHLSRIFDRFERVDMRLTREVNGLGLGLTICKCIVALHHGHLWAESQANKGSTFYIWLPLAQTASMDATQS